MRGCGSLIGSYTYAKVDQLGNLRIYLGVLFGQPDWQMANDFGDKLRQLREARGLGIKTVGKELSVSYSYLSKVENGHKVPSTDLVQKLAELYDVDPEEMLAKLAELPPDIQQIIQERGKEVFDLLRKTYATQPRNEKKKTE